MHCQWELKVSQRLGFTHPDVRPAKTPGHDAVESKVLSDDRSERREGSNDNVLPAGEG